MEYGEYVKKFRAKYGKIFTIRHEWYAATKNLRVFIVSGPPIGWIGDASKKSKFMSISTRGLALFHEKWDDRDAYDLFRHIASDVEEKTKGYTFNVTLYVGSPAIQYSEEY
jgi:hypothetical protein